MIFSRSRLSDGLAFVFLPEGHYVPKLEGGGLYRNFFHPQQIFIYKLYHNNNEEKGKMKKALILFVSIVMFLTTAFFIAPNFSYSYDFQYADIFVTPKNCSDFFSGYTGGNTCGSIGWSMGNCSPFSLRTNDMVFSTCTGVYTNPNDWQERMRITNDGNVGVGIANPSAKLEVAGTIRAVNFERISGTMKWDISGHPENQTTVSWLGNSTWIIQDSLSQMRITHNNSNELYPFDEYQDGPAIAKARRWYVTITDLPENAEWPERVVSATFFGYDSAPSSVLDGSTFGEISIWEVSPTTPREIILVVDFTKVRSQAHKFGIQLLITHLP